MTAADDRTTVVHLLRHGEVHNPEGILYGRLSGYNLSDLGTKMAMRVAEALAERDVTHLVASPLERAQQTARPLADRLGQDIVTDARVIESGNHFEGMAFGAGKGAFRRPSSWWVLRNPWKPSWGEPYKQVVDRMLAAMADARDDARGHEAVIVSHQLPIWITRSAVEGLPFLHDPRRRHCTLCSLTSFTYVDHEVVSVSYSEPAADLLPARGANAPFSAGA
ncbi:MAG TPA: histidine phosphatase family protein [Nocardioidaceae bacterium]|nr:histidine phosphatase family protein [Nocardioidaceae bacterium]